MSFVKKAFLLLSLGSLSISSPASQLETNSTKSHVNNLATRDSTNYWWTAIGDSFAAGPGAGTQVRDDNEDERCYRFDNAYPVQLYRMMEKRMEDGVIQRFKFKPCTGAKIPTMEKNQLRHIDRAHHLVTLSIGGNDVGFTNILKHCIVMPGRTGCDRALSTADDYINRRLKKDILKTYNKIFDRFGDEEDSTKSRSIIHQLYPKFFNQTTTYCSSRNIFNSKSRLFPKLSRKIRKRLNRMVDNVNRKIKAAAQDWRIEHPTGNHEIYFTPDHDTIYNGHRFCDEGFESFYDPDIWFFMPIGSDSDMSKEELFDKYNPDDCADNPKHEEDFEYTFYCSAAIKLNQDGNRDEDIVPQYAYGIKSFHPKSIAHKKIAKTTKLIFNNLIKGDVVAERELHDVDGGKLQCRRVRESSNKSFFVPRDNFTNAIDEFCVNDYSDREENINGLWVYVKKSNCANTPENSEAWTDRCKSSLMHCVDKCDTASLDWKQGGIYSNDCWTFHISKHKIYREFDINGYMHRAEDVQKSIEKGVEKYEDALSDLEDGELGYDDNKDSYEIYETKQHEFNDEVSESDWSDGPNPDTDEEEAAAEHAKEIIG